MKKPSMKYALLLSSLYVAGCAADLQATNNGNGIDRSTTEPRPIIDTEFSNAGNQTTVNASSYDEWVYFSFENPVEPISVEEPSGDLAWDLGFRRFHIKLNGGISGTGLGALAFSDEAKWEDVSAEEEYLSTVDKLDGADENEDLDLAFLVAGGGWYQYEKTVLTPKPRIYVITSADGAKVKLEIDSYYDEAGSSARLSFTWQPL